MEWSHVAFRASNRKTAGFSLIESMVAVAIISLSLGAMMTLNGHQLRMVKISRDVNAATLYQQERVEQLRQVRWPDLTSSTYISGTYLPKRPASSAALDRITEAITISAYPNSVAGSTPLLVSQAIDGTTTVDTQKNGYALTNERLVRIDLQLGWKAADGRPRTRFSSTLVSNSGVTRHNLPAMGPVSGGPYEAFNTPVTGTPAAITPVAATPVPATPAPTNNGNGNGNGNGRGNTGGKNGQG